MALWEIVSDTWQASSAVGGTLLIQAPENQRKRIAGARRVLGVFAVAWLGLALQPCVMAAAADSGCPGCPPGMDHGAVSPHAAADHSTTPVPCAVDDADCMRADVYGHDTRGGNPSAKHAPGKTGGDGCGDGSATASAQAAVAILDTALGSRAITRDPPPEAVRGRWIDPATLPPRNVLFCVYLK